MRVLVVNAGSSSLKLSVLDGDRVEQRPRSSAGTGRATSTRCGTFLERAPGRRRGRAPGRARRSPVPRVGAGRRRGGRLPRLDRRPGAAAQPAGGGRDPGRCGDLLPDVPAVAAFDTSFHATIPDEAATYALPREWNHRFGLRRYGFHGLSHAYAVRRGAELVGRDARRAPGRLLPPRGGRLAVRRPRGPLGRHHHGLHAAGGAGDADPRRLGRPGPPAVAARARRRRRDDARSGARAPVRASRVCPARRATCATCSAAREAGDADAALAFDVYVHRLVREIGAMTASAGGLDVLVFTGGMGEHSPELRAAAAARLAHLGVDLDDRLQMGVTRTPTSPRPAPGCTPSWSVLPRTSRSRARCAGFSVERRTFAWLRRRAGRAHRRDRLRSRS